LAKTGVTMTPSLLMGSLLVLLGVAAWVADRRSRRGSGQHTS
jgi:LPXTG-motif cell wall-anchored protein